MLTIGKLGANRGQLQYYERQVAAGLEDYYAGRGEARGVWLGAGTAALGLTSGRQVQAAGFMALMRGASPVDHRVLRAMGQCSTVAAIDLTFSAPKSVSVLFAVTEADVSSALVDAHERAVEQALGYLEREACWTRRGHSGVDRVRGEGFVAAAYRHRMSRAGDPQLHTHVVVGNLTRAAGRYTALDAHALYEHKSAAGAVYRAVLRGEVRARLPWVGWRPVGRGLFEIDGVPEAVLRQFSQRRVEIEERAAELAGNAAGGLSRERMQGVALATRRPKDSRAAPAGWREQARARAAEHGFGKVEMADLMRGPERLSAELDLGVVVSRLSGASGLTEMHNTFARRHALAEVAGAFAGGGTVAAIEAATVRYLADPSVRELDAAIGHDARFTTESLLMCERAIVDGTERRRNEQTATLPADAVARTIDRHQPVLNDGQASAIHALTRAGHGVEVVSARAGTGKTTMIAALAEAYQDQGYRVIGTAPTARAARELRSAGGVPAGTMHALLAELDRTGQFRERTVLVIDEAGMAPTRLAAAIFAHAERSRTKIIAVGDPGQLASVQAGGWLGALDDRHPGPRLREVIRQHDPAERVALEALHDGHPEVYLAHKQGDITVHAEEQQAVEALVNEWDAARQEHGSTHAVMIARDNHTRQQLNHAARERLKREEVLTRCGVRVAAHEYAPGDQIIARRNDRSADVDNGMLGTVVAIDTRAHRMVIETGTGERRELDLAYVAWHVEHAYALTGHSAQGSTVSWAGVIGRPQEFSREWAYTALSRARKHTTVHLIAAPSADVSDRASYAPQQPEATTADVLATLKQSLNRSEVELLAIDQCELHAALLPADKPPAQRRPQAFRPLRAASTHTRTVAR